MAASTTVFSTTPTLGVNLGATGVSTPAFALLTRLNGNDGHEYLYVQANEAIGSITTVIVSSSGSVSTDAGSAGWTANCPGGLTASQFGWIKRTTLA